MRVMAQMGMVMNLDKCIGCSTCSVTCKQAWTNRPGVEYVWFNNVETRPGQGYPRVRGPGEVERRLEARSKGSTPPQSGWPNSQVGHDLQQSQPAQRRRLLRAVDVRLRLSLNAPVYDDFPRRAPKVADHGQGHESRVVRNRGR